MPSRYQTVFIISGLGRNGPDLLEDVRNYIRGTVHEQFGIPLVALTDNGGWENENGELQIDSDRRDSFAYFTLTWRRPDEWEMRWRLATKGDDVEAEVQVLGPDNDKRTAGAPALLDDVLRTYHCRIQGETPYPDVVTVTNENADWYSDSLLFNPERRMPVVAVSERLRGDPNGLANRALNILRGIATVVTYTYVDGVAINSRLGRLACSGGEVRVYRPGADPSDVQVLHRKWRPQDARLGEIRDECMHLLSQYDDPRLYHDVREEIFRLWDEELAESEEEEDSISDEKVAAFENELAEAKTANKSAEKEREEWRGKHEALEWESGREIKRLEKDSQDASKTIGELLDQINASSPAETVIGQMRVQISDLRSELERRVDQSEDVARLAYERDEAKKSTQDLARDYRSVVADRDSLQRQVNEVESVGTDKHSQRKETAKLRGELKEKETRINDLLGTLSDLERRIRELQGEMAKQSQESEGYLQDREPSFASDEEPADVGDEPEYSTGVPPAPPKTAREVILNSQNLPGLRYLDSVSISVADSNFAHVISLDRVLKAISECGTARAKGPLGVNVETWFKQRGVDYRPHESEQTNIRHPRVYRDGKCGVDLDMQEHIALGAGGNRDPKDVLRIHMAWCENKNVRNIGHVGRLLDVATS